MKKKSLTMLLTGLLAVSLTGVGFASWIIVQGDEENVSGSVNVETINTEKVNIVPVWRNNDGDGVTGSLNEDYATSNTDLATIDEQGDNQFSFGAPKGEATTGWLRSDTEYGEVLTLVLRVYVTAHAEHVKSIVPELTATGFEDAVTSEYLTTPKCVVGTSSKENVDGTEYTYYDLTISTSWGVAFGSENPYTYFKGVDVSTDEKLSAAISEAETKIGGLETALEDASFTLKIKATVA